MMFNSQAEHQLPLLELDMFFHQLIPMRLLASFV